MDGEMSDNSSRPISFLLNYRRPVDVQNYRSLYLKEIKETLSTLFRIKLYDVKLILS